MWVEHLESRSANPDLADSYKNCYLACRFCNNTRSNRPRRGERGEELLDPCKVGWSAHFTKDGDRLQARPGDADADYTARLYSINDPRRVECRRMRREALERALAIWDSTRDGKLMARLREIGEVGVARTLSLARREAQEQIMRYAVIPRDADTACACRQVADLTLPDWLIAQALEV